MDTIQELQNFRTRLIQDINIMFDSMILKLREEQDNSGSVRVTAEVREYESIYPLAGVPGIFKGKKPTGVRFPDGTRVDVPTWKRGVEVILQRCINIPEKHDKLLLLRGKVSGRARVLISERADGMRSPLKIEDNLYVETHYDTETLLKILTTRILDVIGYDYRDITITVRND